MNPQPGCIVIETNPAKNKYWVQTQVAAQAPDAMHSVVLWPQVRGQTFAGCGGAFTQSAAYNWNKLNDAAKREFLEAYFADSGLRYNLGRAHMNSCDFSLQNYACVTDPADSALQTFSVEEDAKYVFPLIAAAQAVAKKPIGLLLSPWSPPAFMKTNGDMNHGGALKPAFYGLWAQCIANYVQAYRAQGFDVRMVSVQNEPAAVQTWDSCIYTAQEEALFAADYLKPALEAANLADIQILAWDHNKEILVSRVEETLQDTARSSAVDGFGVHWYTGDHFEAVRAAVQAHPEKAFYFTEGCVEYSRFDKNAEQDAAEMYAHDMIGNFNAGIVGHLDWNLLLDAEGGPNHVGNFCAAPVMLCADETTFEKKRSYYYIGHFSRYIKPGAVQITASRYTDQVEATAFEDADGIVVAVLLNRTERPLPVSLRLRDAAYSFTLEAHSIVTAILQSI